MHDAINAFWAWWPGGKLGFEGGLPPAEERMEELGSMISAIDPRLELQLGRGVSKSFSLCVTAAGELNVREAAARWQLEAPSDAAWEFLSARPAVPDHAISLGGGTVRSADARFRISATPDEKIDVVVDERALRSIPPPLRGNAAFLLLDGLLGEEDVERYLGTIDVRPIRFRSTGPEVLMAAVDQLRNDRPGRHARGEHGYVFVETTRQGTPFIVTANASIRRIDHPLHSAHATITLAMLDPTDAGLTTNLEADVLNDLQDELDGALGAHSLSPARETRGGTRIIHYYLDPRTDAPRIAEYWANACATRTATAAITYEPDWASVTPFGIR